MSAMNVDSFATERFGSAGPLVCATNLDAMDWMPEDRIWTPEPGGSSVSTIDLVALSHAEIPGPLCARLGGFYVEFRINDGWDKGLAGPRILIHTLSGSNAIIIARDLGSYIYDWQPGQSFGPPPVILAINGGDTMSVVSFDVQAKKARLRITHTARKPIFDGPTGMVLGGVEVDAGGWIIVGGHIVKVPPRSPMLKLLSRVALLSQAHDLLGESEFGRIAAPVFEDVEGLAKEGRKQIG
jgi:hypothetical protein